MNPKNHNNNQTVQAITNKQSVSSPKLTVKEIVEKFVKPSTHRKIIMLSEPEHNKL